MANLTWPLKWGRVNDYARRIVDSVGKALLKQYIPRQVWYYCVELTYSDFSAAALTKEVDLNATFTSNLFPANALIFPAIVETVTLFSGGSVDSCVLSAGDTDDDDELFEDLDVFTGATTGAQCPVPGNKFDLAYQYYEAAYAPTATLTTTTGNTSTLTAGKAVIRIPVEPIADLGGK